MAASAPAAPPARKRYLFPYLWISPAVFLMILAVIIPVGFTVYISGTNYNQYHLFDYHWIGLKHYQDAFSTDPYTGYAHAYLWLFGWTVAFAAGCTVVNLTVGLFLALLVNNPRLPGRIIFRSLLILPWALPFTITATTWRGILNTNFGAVNQILKAIGLGQPGWLDDPSLVKISLIVINLWFSFPFFMVISLGILQSIPNDLYEAGEIDGANALSRLLFITLPSIRAAIMPLVVAQFAFQFNNAVFIYAITQGNPPSTDPSGRSESDILASYLFQQVSASRNFSSAAALGVLIFVVVMILSLINVRLTGAFKEAK